MRHARMTNTAESIRRVQNGNFRLTIDPPLSRVSLSLSGLQTGHSRRNVSTICTGDSPAGTGCEEECALYSTVHS